MSIFEITALISILMIGSSIIYSTVRVGISPMPSSKKAYQAILELTDDTNLGTIYDLGSGWGNLVIRLAKHYPERQIIGYELSFFPWLCTCLLKRVLGLTNLTVYRKDFLQADLSEAEVIICYLFPKTMTKLRNKLRQEKGKLQFVISNNFALPAQQVSKTIRIDDFYKSPIYFYEMNQTAINM